MYETMDGKGDIVDQLKALSDDEALIFLSKELDSLLEKSRQRHLLREVFLGTPFGSAVQIEAWKRWASSLKEDPIWLPEILKAFDHVTAETEEPLTELWHKKLSIAATVRERLQILRRTAQRLAGKTSLADYAMACWQTDLAQLASLQERLRESWAGALNFQDASRFENAPWRAWRTSVDLEPKFQNRQEILFASFQVEQADPELKIFIGQSILEDVASSEAPSSIKAFYVGRLKWGTLTPKNVMLSKHALPWQHLKDRAQETCLEFFQKLSIREKLDTIVMIGAVALYPLEELEKLWQQTTSVLPAYARAQECSRAFGLIDSVRRWGKWNHRPDLYDFCDFMRQEFRAALDSDLSATQNKTRMAERYYFIKDLESSLRQTCLEEWLKCVEKLPISEKREVLKDSMLRHSEPSAFRTILNQLWGCARFEKATASLQIA